MRAWWFAAWLLVGCGTPEVHRAPPPPVPIPEPIVVPPQPMPPFSIAAPADKVVAIGRGDRHACAVRASGAVDCWGQHARGNNETYVPAAADASVRRVPDVTDATAIGRDAQCIARKGGDVACLDLDKFVVVPVAGMGIASMVDGPCALVGTSVRCKSDDQVVEAVNLPDIVQLRSTLVNGCALRKNGDAWCGNVGNKWARVRGLDHIEDLAVASGYGANACVATKTSARCMQLDFYDHIVHDPADLPQLAGARDLGMYQSEGRLDVAGVIGGKVVQVELTSEGGELGTRELPLLDDAVQHVFGCALRAQGSVVCWGSNDGGALAQRTTIDQVHVPPVKVAALTDIADIAIGTTKTYALTRAGQVFQWGSSRRWDRNAYPKELPLGLGPSLLVQIEALREDELCMRSANGLVWCQNIYGSNEVMRVDTSDVQHIVAGGGSIYAIRANGYLERHGIGRDELGDEVLLHSTETVDVATGWESECFLRRNGVVRCPRPVPELQGATRIASAAPVVCGILRGHVVCAVIGKSETVEVPGIVDATDLAATRFDHACAVHHGGRVTCWHIDDDAKIIKQEDVIASGAIRVKLGAGSEDQLQQSHALDGPAPGGELGCAIMEDRTVQCWGTNLRGELGDGSIVETTSPIGVAL